MAYRNPKLRRENEFKLRLSSVEHERVEAYLRRTGQQLAVEARDALMERVARDEREAVEHNQNSTQVQCERKSALQYA